MSDRPSLPATVYLLSHGMLFDEVLAHMLIPNPGLRVIRRVYSGEDAFLRDVRWCRPDVILLHETELLSGSQLVTLLSRLSLASVLRVIALSLDNTDVHIFDQRANQMTWQAGIPHTVKKITDWNELFDLVEGSPRLSTGC